MTNEPNPNQQPVYQHEITPEDAAISPRKALVGVAVVVIVAGALAGYGILRRHQADTLLATATNEQAAPTVIVAAPKAGAPVDNFVLPGNVTSYTDSPIYARTSGYLTRWYFDIGAKVKKGSLLAEIATPEVDQQLAQAQADLVTAQANANNARIQAERYTGLVQSDAVSRQDTDTFVNQAAATASAVKSAQANVERLRQLQSFEKVYAPFDGVITARNVDTGQLIDPGAGKELFRLQAIQTLRVYANLPQMYSANVKPGAKIDLTFAEHAGTIYQGTLVRTSDAIDPISRTLLVEIDVDNRAGELCPARWPRFTSKRPPPAPPSSFPPRRSSSARRVCAWASSSTATSLIWFPWSSARTTGPACRSSPDSDPATRSFRIRPTPSSMAKRSRWRAPAAKPMREASDMPAPLAAERLLKFANLLTRYHREPVANLLPLSNNHKNRAQLGTPCPILSVILSGAQRSRRTCFLFFWRKGGRPQSSANGCPTLAASLFLRLGWVFVAAAFLTGCKPVGPNYSRPGYEAPPAYRETGATAVLQPPPNPASGAWQPANPSDSLLRGKWWEIYQDPQLNQLEERIAANNQTLRQALESYLAARDQVSAARSGFFPTLSAGPSAQRESVSTNGPSFSAGKPTTTDDFLLTGQASWEPDLWGRIRRTVEAARSNAQASAADQANVALSLHAEMAADYFQLRGLDAEIKLLDSTVADLERQLDLTQRRSVARARFPVGCGPGPRRPRCRCRRPIAVGSGRAGAPGRRRWRPAA